MAAKSSDRLNNAANNSTRGSNSSAPKLPAIVMPVKGSRTNVDQAAVATAAANLANYKQQVKNSPNMNQDRRGDNKITGSQQRQLDRLRKALETAQKGTKQNTWKIGGKTYTNRNEALKATDKINKANGYQVNTNKNYGDGGIRRFTAPPAPTPAPAPAASTSSGKTGTSKVAVDDAGNLTDTGNSAIAGRDNADLVTTGAITGTPEEQAGAGSFEDQFTAAIDDFYRSQMLPQLNQNLTGTRENDNVNTRGVNYYDQNFFEDAIYGDGGIYNTAIGEIKTANDPNRVYDFDPYLNTTAAEGLINDVVTSEGLARSNEFANVFGYNPNNQTSSWVNETFNNTLDDAWIDDMLSSAYGTNTNALDRALSYGQINQAGYDAGLADLGTQRTNANTTLQDLGSGILTGYADQTLGRNDQSLDNGLSISSVYDTLDDFGLGAKYDTSGDISGIRSGASDLASGYEGAFGTAAGSGSDYFNIADSLAAATKGSGIFDPIKEGTAGAFFEQLTKDKKKSQATRGLGGTGSF